MVQQITPQELARRLASAEPPPLLLDVREPWEFQVCRIAGSESVPMRRITAELATLDRERPVVVICHHGIRSQQVALYLAHQGFPRVLNLVGGVAAWADSVEPAMPRY